MPDSAENRALEALAKGLAAAVASGDVRQALHQSIGKRFDGDTNALWSDVAAGSKFNAKVAAAASRGQSRNVTADQIDSAARAFPRLQIAVPEKFDSWDPTEYALLVTYFPVGVDDLAVDTLTAYDVDGKVVLLGAQAPPANPVIVVGMNERTDKTGKLKDEESVDRSASLEPSAVAAVPSYQVRMYIVGLRDDKESWALGDAEINMESKGEDCGFVYDDYNWSGLNNSGDAWEGPRTLGYTTCNVIFYWWEDDGGSADIALKWGPVDFGVSLDNDDDRSGGGRIYHSQFAGAGTDTWDKLTGQRSINTPIRGPVRGTQLPPHPRSDSPRSIDQEGGLSWGVLARTVEDHRGPGPPAQEPRPRSGDGDGGLRVRSGAVQRLPIRLTH